MASLPEIDNKNNQQKLQNTQIVATQLYSGPLPPASELARYEQVLPGAADRIIAMAEKQLTHRTEYEYAAISSQIKLEKLSRILAFLFAITGLVCAVVVAFFGFENLAIGIAVTTIGTVVASIVTRGAQNKK